MFHRYFSGLKLSSSALAILLIAAGLYFGACSKDKEETETVEETESVEVEVEAPGDSETETGTEAETGAEADQSHRKEGMPPEISGPCKGKNEGDSCMVVVTGGAEIKGTCKMSTRKNLGCMPDPILNKDKVQEPDWMSPESDQPSGE